ncbi:IS21 family transposase, partial [Cysteiniphilum sp. 6C5]
MARKRVTTEQVKLYMKLRQDDKLIQAGCAAKAGFSERTARTIDRGKHHTQHPPKQRQYKTRASSIDKLWEDELKQKLEDNPELQPTTLYIDLQRNHVDDQGNPIYDASCLRTLQRRVREWKAKHGASKEVMFPQKHYPGDQGLSDFSHMKDIGITIAGKPLDHMIYHFRLVFSKYSYVKVILSGESFQALSEGLQEALFHIGGAPNEHRTDSLAAAYKNDKDVANEDLTDRYKELCAYYGMNPTRNNKGVSHENGSVESSHGHLKNRIKQELMVRGSKDFETLAEYEQWLRHVVENSNRRNSKNFKLEQSALQPLPKHKTADYEVKSVKVSSHSMINIKQIKYSVPARLVGHALTVHISQKDIIAYLGSSEV